MRTYSASDWQAAAQAWQSGHYEGPAWQWVRELARERGMLYPPATTGSDDPTADHPSQCALLARSIYDEPELVRYAITHPKANSWHDVLALVLEERDGARQAAAQAERAYRAEKASYATQREAAASLATIMQTLADSVGAPPPTPVVRATAAAAYRRQLLRRAEAFHHQRHDSDTWESCRWQECQGMYWLLEGGEPTE